MKLKSLFIAMLALLSLASCTNYGKKVKSGNVEVYYKDGAEKADAQKLADLFGVSRTLVRQALFQLSQHRLIKLEPARGAFVAGGRSSARWALASRSNLPACS